jgi:hypothetical protein
MSDLRKRLKQSSEHLKTRDMSTKSPSAIFNTYYTLPETLSTWVPKVGDKEKKYFIDIIPFPYGPNFPNEMWKTPWKIGDYPHTMMVDVHKNVGPEDAWVICPKNNFAERCPICEDMVRRQKNEPDAEARKKIWADLRTSRRQMYYVVVRDGDEEEDKGVQLWEVAAFYMADKLDTIRFQGRSGEVVDYWDVDDGKTIEFTIKKKGDFAEYSGHAFTDRIDPSTKKKYVISDDLIEAACDFPLDQSLNRMAYDDVLKIYLAEPATKKTEEEEPPVSRRRTAAVAEEPAEQEEETPPPTRRRRTAIVEEPAPPKEGECPAGGVFGRDCLKLVPQCDDCETQVYNLCQSRKDELDALEPAPRRRRR